MSKLSACMMALLFLFTSTGSLAGYYSNEDVGTITGGIAGGILGSTIGKGTGQIVAVAAGTLAGALIGGSVGKNMDSADRRQVRIALENNPVGAPAYWRNAQTGTRYRVIPIRNVTVNGNYYCREYRTIAYIGGRQQEMYGTACRQVDGSWKAVH